jgi:hypothetical protein
MLAEIASKKKNCQKNRRPKNSEDKQLNQNNE